MKRFRLRLKGYWNTLLGACPRCGGQRFGRLGCPVCAGWEWDQSDEHATPPGHPPWEWWMRFELWLRTQ